VTKYAGFCRFLGLGKATVLNIKESLLLGCLYEKKRRNFDLHSNIEDFFLDCRTTFQYSFNDLLQKNDLAEVFDNKESNVLKSIDETYFSDQIDRIRRLERQRTSNLV